MDIDNVLARAQRMMLDENWNAQVEMGAAAQRAGSLNGSKNTGNDLAAFEAHAFGSVSTPAVGVNFTPIPEEAKRQKARAMITDSGKPIQMLSESTQQRNIRNSQLPKNVIESFAAQPPLSGDDDYSMPPASYYPQSASPQRQVVVEQQYQPQIQQPAGIDYNALKYIINECIKENMKSINESTNMTDFRGMRIGNGSVIQFVDSKGNLYEGKLVLKKKANQ